jgi:arylsulfatase A-like enzyme
MLFFKSLKTYLCLGVAFGGLTLTVFSKAENPPNIIYILADDLGYGDLGCYGQQEIKTPEIDQLAKDGMRFTNHYAGSTVCSPSRSVLMTGLHTGHNRIRGNANLDYNKDDVTVAMELKKAGYRTGIIGKWGLGNIGTDGTPNAKGFDFSLCYINQTRAHNSYPDYLWKNGEKLELPNEVEYVKEGHGAGITGVARKKIVHSHTLFTDETLAFIERNQTQPFFLYLAYTIPHANNEANRMGQIGMEVPDLGIYADKSWPEAQKAQAAMISLLDRDVGRIVDLLDKLGLSENTLVIFTSDNGPHAEGGADPSFFNSNGGLRGQKRDLYEGGIRIPFIAKWDGVVPAGRVCDYPSAFWDFMPTACEIAGIQELPNTDGISYLPSLKGETQDPERVLYWEFPINWVGNGAGYQVALRKGKWKAVRSHLETEFGAVTELYNLETDPAEMNGLASQYPGKVKELEALMAEEHTHSEPFTSPPPVSD